MPKLGKEHVMVACEMRISAMWRGQLGVSEGTIRYHRRKAAAGNPPDGRSSKPTALDGDEGAVEAILEGLECWRMTGEGRPAQAQAVFEVLLRDYDFTGSYQSVVRHLRRRYGTPPVRALRRVETPPGVQAQHDWFEVPL